MHLIYEAQVAIQNINIHDTIIINIKVNKIFKKIATVFNLNFVSFRT